MIVTSANSSPSSFTKAFNLLAANTPVEPFRGTTADITIFVSRSFATRMVSSFSSLSVLPMKQ